MATIDEIRADHHAIITQPAGAGTPLIVRCWRCREVWPCDTVRVLAALDETNAQIARDAPLLAAAEALGACLVRWPGYVPFLRADDEESALIALAAALDARRAATTPQKGDT